MSDFSVGSHQTNSPLSIGLYSYNPFNVICCCLLDGKTKALILDFRVLSKMPNPDCFQDDQLLFPVSLSCALLRAVMLSLLGKESQWLHEHLPYFMRVHPTHICVYSYAHIFI